VVTRALYSVGREGVAEVVTDYSPPSNFASTRPNCVAAKRRYEASKADFSDALSQNAHGCRLQALSDV